MLDLAIIDGPATPIAGVPIHKMSRAPVDPARLFHANGIIQFVRTNAPRVRFAVWSIIAVDDPVERDKQMAKAIRKAGSRAPIVNISMGRPWEQPRTCRAFYTQPLTRFIVASSSVTYEDPEQIGLYPARCGAPNITTAMAARQYDPNYPYPADKLIRDATSGSHAAIILSTRIAKRRRQRR